MKHRVLYELDRSQATTDLGRYVPRILCGRTFDELDGDDATVVDKEVSCDECILLNFQRQAEWAA